jgi:hypothetical protein
LGPKPFGREKRSKRVWLGPIGGGAGAWQVCLPNFHETKLIKLP